MRLRLRTGETQHISQPASFTSTRPPRPSCPAHKAAFPPTPPPAELAARPSLSWQRDAFPRLTSMQTVSLGAQSESATPFWPKGSMDMRPFPMRRSANFIAPLGGMAGFRRTNL